MLLWDLQFCVERISSVWLMLFFYRSIIDMHKSRKDKSRQKKFLPIKRNSRVSLCCQTLPFIKLSKLSSLFVKDLISHYMFSIRIPVYSSDWGMDAFHSFIYFIEYQSPSPPKQLWTWHAPSRHVSTSAWMSWHACGPTSAHVSHPTLTNQSLFHLLTMVTGYTTVVSFYTNH